MSQTEVWTIGRLLEWTTGFLKTRGADSPRLDAEVLLAHARGCERIALYTSFTEVPDEALRNGFRDLVRRRAEGTPVAYLVGHREFYSMSFQVTPDVLIPRPETELLVVRLLDLLAAAGKDIVAAGGDLAATPLTLADVGTGSGIIAICAAKKIADLQVTAVDLSPAALAVATTNAQTHQVAGRIQFLQGDLLSQVAETPTFDVIASNPPYITTAEMATLQRDVRDYEPHLALEAGERGTEVIERLIPQAAARLKPGGWLLLEISPTIHSLVRDLLVDAPVWELHPTIKDHAHPRVVQARRTVVDA